MRSTPRHLFALLWPFVLQCVALALMAVSWQADPHDPTLVGTARYGHNHEGALFQMVACALAEMAILYVVLGPGAARPRVWRAAAALLLFAPWTLFSLLLTMHAGGVVAVHALWLIAVDLGIVAVLVARAIARR